MVKAIGKVIVGDKTYHPGDTVYGLTKSDIDRMQRDGMIEAIPDAPKKKDKVKPKEQSPEEV